MNKNLLLGIAVLMMVNANAQYSPLSDEQHTYGAVAGEGHLLGVTKPLRETPPIYSTTSSNKNNHREDVFEEHKYNKAVYKGALPKGADPARQIMNHHMKVNMNIDTLLTVDGLNATGVTPPDPNGDVGLNEYIEMVNGPNGATFNIIDKNGVQVYGPAMLNTFWTQFGASGLGDGIVLFDQQAQRWLMTELNANFSGVLVAVSQTSDPTGAYYAYEFSTGGLPDYSKFFIWNNGYYFCANEGSTATPVYALNRSLMLTGAAFTNMLTFTMPGFSAIGFQLASGADWDGATPPPAGSPAYVLRMYDDSWAGGVDHLEVWQFNVDWVNTNNSTLVGPLNLPTLPFVSSCGGGVAQPSGSQIDDLEQIIMHRVQYRNFGSYESMVCNHVVNADGAGLAGIRWYELRKSGLNPWSIYQQGTYSPDPTTHHWMGSIAQDASGNIALGCSVTSNTVNPSLRIVARKFGDPLGQMTYNELQYATGSTSYSGNRWGDYSNMSVDPVDDRTFWFMGEYMGPTDWSTKIVKFVLRDSNDVAVSQLIQPVTAGNLTNAEVLMAEVKNLGYNADSNFNISYQINGGPVITENIGVTLLPDSSVIHTFATTGDFSTINGVYNVKVYTSLSNDDDRNNDTLLTQVVHLSNSDAAALTILGGNPYVCGASDPFGFVLKNAGADTLHTVNINYTVNGSGVVTYPWSGNLPQFGIDTVMITLSGLINGTNTVVYYTSQPNGVGDQQTSNDTTTISFTDVSQAQVIAPLIQGFELTAFPPQYWADASNQWVRKVGAGGFGNSFDCAEYPFFSTPANGNLITAFIDLSSLTSPAKLDFNIAHARYDATYSDTMLVKISTDCGTTWTTLWMKGGTALATVADQTTEFTPNLGQWRHESIDITSYIGQSTALFEFAAVSGYGNDLYLDDINIYDANAIPDVSAESGINVYPNPSSGNFTIQISEKDLNSIVISVYNSIGEKIKEISSKGNNTSQFEINMDGQSDGIYLLKIETNKKIVNKTVNIIR